MPASGGAVDDGAFTSPSWRVHAGHTVPDTTMPTAVGHTAAMANDGVHTGPLDGQTALITGGGSGIGLACAAALATDGASVVLAARNVERLGSAAADLRERVPGARVATVACDVTDEASVEAACAEPPNSGCCRSWSPTPGRVRRGRFT